MRRGGGGCRFPKQAVFNFSFPLPLRKTSKVSVGIQEFVETKVFLDVLIPKFLKKV